MVDAGQKIKAILETQLTNYREMKQAVEKQTIFIENTNLNGLAACASETRALMRKIRDLDAELRPLRQTWYNLGLDRPVIEKRQVDVLVDEVRAVIESIQEIKNKNTSLLEDAKEKVHAQMTGMKVRTTASRAYQRRPVQAPAARFIDRSK